MLRLKPLKPDQLKFTSDRCTAAFCRMPAFELMDLSIKLQDKLYRWAAGQRPFPIILYDRCDQTLWDAGQNESWTPNAAVEELFFVGDIYDLEVITTPLGVCQLWKPKQYLEFSNWRDQIVYTQASPTLLSEMPDFVREMFKAVPDIALTEEEPLIPTDPAKLTSLMSEVTRCRAEMDAAIDAYQRAVETYMTASPERCACTPYVDQSDEEPWGLHWRTKQALVRAGYPTHEALRRQMAKGNIDKIKGVGKKRRQELIAYMTEVDRRGL